MSTIHFGLLDEREESELHKTRLLNVEEKPFKRLTKRLVAPGAFTNPNKRLATAPSDSNNASTNNNASAESQDAGAVSSANPSAAEIAALKEDITLDFAAFDSAIARLQFLAKANAAERERYAADRLRILGTMESVREGNARLRGQLEEARATLAQRRKFDELADRITSNRMLRTRAEQDVNLAKLAEECEELHRESETYGATWRDRREQFERLVDEGKRLRALIRDEKEEVERREGMDSDAEDGETGPNGSSSNNGGSGAAGAGAGATPKPGILSGNVTPRPDSSVVSSSAKGEGNTTPRPGSRDGRTPRPDSPAAGGGDGGLKPRPDVSGSFSRSESQAPSLRAGSQQPTTQQEDDGPEEGEDVEMGETPAAATTAADAATPQITVDAPAANGDKMDTT
ncbi:Tho complex subunit 7-domain-containing protein [Biscogniauxia sp. FL1348]|nr:Tho complex subunit 7-domain-containing protein [Biscogniauxia sp. FL1348]